MAKTKIQTCRYNANRHVADIAYPYCTWVDSHQIPMPPHIRWSFDYKIYGNICKQCKVYESVDSSGDE